MDSFYEIVSSCWDTIFSINGGSIGTVYLPTLIDKDGILRTQNNNQYFVEIDKGGSQTEMRQVTVGLNDGTNMEITSGLKVGEKVFAY